MVSFSGGKTDKRAQILEQMKSQDAVVFTGDGEPQSPQSTIARLNSLLAEGRLQPDSYSLGGAVQALEERMASELGKEAAIWMPTGTLANHLALRRHAGTTSRVILQEQSHAYQDEGDALARLSGLNGIPLAKGRPFFTADELRAALDEAVTGRVLNPAGAVSIESPVRRQAGQIVPFDEMQAVTELCREEGIPSHLDGARLYMMSAATGVGIKTYADLFDSVYVSTWKYFGSPLGAILVGNSDFIEGMYHDRRMFGGGLPSGYLPAALSLAGVDGFEERFAQAFARAEEVFAEINKLVGVSVRKFEHGSNIFELVIDEAINTDQFVDKLLEAGIVLNAQSGDWPVPLLHVNTTILRRPINEIVEAFSSAVNSD
ncbi:MAG TPA: amino acid lyase [Dehalococcoidia bacterium]|jgi:threonine aldolase|nr:amino acid lyase [Dehalococcoidia bacterium]HIK90008.1 amino acid lyase [Dehalococcoidia bacterium]